jgi:hypothetical protein
MDSRYSGSAARFAERLAFPLEHFKTSLPFSPLVLNHTYECEVWHGQAVSVLPVQPSHRAIFFWLAAQAEKIKNQSHPIEHPFLETFFTIDERSRLRPLAAKPQVGR